MFIIILSSYYVTVVYLLTVAHSIVAAAVTLGCSLIFHQHFSTHGYGMLLYTEYVYQIVPLSMSQNLNYNSSIRSKYMSIRTGMSYMCSWEVNVLSRKIVQNSY